MASKLLCDNYMTYLEDKNTANSSGPKWIRIHIHIEQMSAVSNTRNYGGTLHIHITAKYQ